MLTPLFTVASLIRPAKLSARRVFACNNLTVISYMMRAGVKLDIDPLKSSEVPAAAAFPSSNRSPASYAGKLGKD
jgi:hypothetical protein